MISFITKVDVDVAGNIISLSSTPVKAIEIFSLTPAEPGQLLRGETLRRFKICRGHRSSDCDCSPRFVAVPPSVPQKLEIFVTDVSKDFIRVFDYDGSLLRRVSLDDPRTGLALAVGGICFVAKDAGGAADEESSAEKGESRANNPWLCHHANQHDIVVVDELG